MDCQELWIKAEQDTERAVKAEKAAYEGFLAARDVWFVASDEAREAQSAARGARACWAKEQKGST